VRWRRRPNRPNASEPPRGNILGPISVAKLSLNLPNIDRQSTNPSEWSAARMRDAIGKGDVG
jgi:hypothetical protein